MIPKSVVYVPLALSLLFFVPKLGMPRRSPRRAGLHEHDRSSSPLGRTAARLLIVRRHRGQSSGGSAASRARARVRAPRPPVGPTRTAHASAILVGSSWA